MQPDLLPSYLSVVRAALARVLDASRTPDAPHLAYAALYRNGLPTPALDHIATEAAVTATEAAIIAAVVLFAPEHAQSPALMHALFTQIQTDGCADRPERCFELVLAWGCGRRAAASGAGPPWPAAVITLAHLCEPLVGTVLRQLAELHLPPPTSDRLAALRADPVAGAQSYAHSLALDLTTSDVLHCWQPARGGLPRYLLERFGGQPGYVRLRSAAFASGLLYPLLSDEIGIMDRSVAFSVCDGPTCNGPQVAAACTNGSPLQLSTLAGRGLFEGTHCVSCGRLAHPERTYRLLRRHWLIVPHTRGGAYEQRLFLNCTACGHHFPCSASYVTLHTALEQFRVATDGTALAPEQRRMLNQGRAELSRMRAATACPLCKRYAVSQRPVQLWVYAPGLPLLHQNMVQ